MSIGTAPIERISESVLQVKLLIHLFIQQTLIDHLLMPYTVLGTRIKLRDKVRALVLSIVAECGESYEWVQANSAYSLKKAFGVREQLSWASKDIYRN